MKNSASKTARLILTVGLVLGLSAGAAFAQTNLIVNGSFESGGAGVGKFQSWNLIGPATVGPAEGSDAPLLPAHQGRHRLHPR